MVPLPPNKQAHILAMEICTLRRWGIPEKAFYAGVS
jgi:hypothetical protein